jgi:hypothetical protein
LILALTTALVATGVTQAFALVFVVTRHAIPRSPRGFHAPLLVSMLTAIATTFALAYMVLTHPAWFEGPLGWALLMFFVADAVTYGTLDVYAVAWHLSIRHRHERSNPRPPRSSGT